VVLQCIGLAFTPASRQLMPVGVMAASRSASALQVESSDALRTSTICCFLTLLPVQVIILLVPVACPLDLRITSCRLVPL